MKGLKKVTSAALITAIILSIFTVLGGMTVFANHFYAGEIVPATSGGFNETVIMDCDTWTGVGTTGTTIDTVNKIQGSGSYKFGAGNNIWITFGDCIDARPLPGGKTFISFWMKINGNGTALNDTTVNLRDYNGAHDFTFWLKQNLYQTTNEWVNVVLPIENFSTDWQNPPFYNPEYVVGRSGANIGTEPNEFDLSKLWQVVITKNGQPAEMWIDDVRIIKSSDQAPEYDVFEPTGTKQYIQYNGGAFYAPTEIIQNNAPWGTIDKVHSQNAVTISHGFNAGLNDLPFFGSALTPVTSGHKDANNYFIVMDMYVGDASAINFGGTVNFSVYPTNGNTADNMTFWLKKIHTGWNKLILPLNFSTAYPNAQMPYADIVLSGNGPVDASGNVTIQGARLIMSGTKATQIMITNLALLTQAEPTAIELKAGSPLEISGDYIKNLTTKTTADMLKAELNYAEYVNIPQPTGQYYITTGNEINLFYGDNPNPISRKTAVVKGDPVADNIINAKDLVAVKKHLLGVDPLTGAYKEAAKASGGAEVCVADIVRLAKIIVGIDTEREIPKQPTIRTSTMKGYESVVTECSVTDFGAVANTSADMTQAFKNAINYAAELGGGTVFVPAGKYKINGTLTLPESVNLLGEWYNPDTNPEKIDQGTVLLAYSGKGSAAAEPFIKIGTGAAVVGVTVYYPEQNASSPFAYPPTFKANDTARVNKSGFSTLAYTTIINPYTGISFGPEWNEAGMVNNVYMSPLKLGVFENLITDICRIEDLHIAAKYYSLYDTSVNLASLKTYMKANSIGVELQRSDWQYMYKSSFEDLNMGINFTRQAPVPTDSPVDSANAQLYDVTMSNVANGINYQYNKMPSQMTKINIAADNEAIKVTSGFSGSLAVSHSTLSSANAEIISMASGATGAVSVKDSIFGARGTGKSIAVVSGGGLSIENSASQTAGNVTVASTAGGAAFTGNSNITITNNAGTKCKSTAGTYALSTDLDAPISLGTAPAPKTNLLINLRDRKINSTAASDVTTVIQTALNDCAAAGGGIVYLPAGKYWVGGTLNIPSNVELRGVSITSHHANALGTVILSTQGEGNESGTAFITLNANSGVKGLLVWYPNQSQQTAVAYPYTITVNGQNAWVVNATVGGAYKGLYLGANSGGHYISGFNGFSYKNDITVDGPATQGFILNSHFNPHFAFRTANSELSMKNRKDDSQFTSFLAYCAEVKTRSFDLRTAANEIIFNSFNYRATVGLYIGNGFKGTLLGCGFDASTVSLEVNNNSAQEVLMINTGLDSVDVGSDEMYIKHTLGNTKMVNSAISAFGYRPDQGVQVNGGNLKLNQVTFNTSARTSTTSQGRGTINVNGGTLNLNSAIFRHVGDINANGVEFNQQTSSNVSDIVKRSGGTLNNTISLHKAFAANVGSVTATLAATY